MLNALHGRAALLLLSSAALFSGTPAFAGRGTQIDVPAAAAFCSLGDTSCTGFDVHASGVFQTAYIYKEGIVSFDALLPANATAADVSSLGTGSWFAPGFSDAANYQVDVFVSFGLNSTNYAINFYAPGATMFDVGDDPDTPDDETKFADLPLFQVQFGLTDTLDYMSQNSETQVAFGYAQGLTGDPLANALIGFSEMGTVQTVLNANGLLVGPAPSDTDFVTRFGLNMPQTGGMGSTDADGNPIFDEDGNQLFDPIVDAYRTSPSLFTPLYAPQDPSAVPEPKSWALMLAAFSVLGGIVRRSAKARSAAA